MKKTNKKSLPQRLLHAKTLEIHGGSSLKDSRSALDRIVAYGLGTLENARKLFAGLIRGFIYTRLNNYTVDRLEQRIAALEGTEASLAVASGMAAIKLFAEYAAHGAHIVSSNRLYGGVFHLFNDILPKLGIKVTFVEDPHSLQAWARAIRPDTRFLYVETPSNPLIEIFDVSALAKLAHSSDILLVVDSTLGGSTLLKPCALGADVVIQSLSKYVGDGEVIAGAIYGKQKMIDDLRLTWFRDSGPCLSPDNAQILLYHIESLSARMHEHCKNARRVAKYLARHPKVKRVFYPNVGENAEQCRKLMPAGFGGLMSFEINGGKDETAKVLESLELFYHEANIGEAKSLVIAPAFTTHNQLNADEQRKAGVSECMIRLSVGREDWRDIIADLAQALDKI